MGSFKAKNVQVTPTPAPPPPEPTPEPVVRAKTRTKYAGAMDEKRQQEEAQMAKKMLLGQ